MCKKQTITTTVATITKLTTRAKTNATKLIDRRLIKGERNWEHLNFNLTYFDVHMCVCVNYPIACNTSSVWYVPAQRYVYGFVRYVICWQTHKTYVILNRTHCRLLRLFATCPHWSLAGRYNSLIFNQTHLFSFFCLSQYSVSVC